MTHDEFVTLWERACKSERRVQTMYFGGPHGFCSEWKIELWSHGQLGARLTIGSCGIADHPGARKTWRLVPSLSGHSMDDGAMTNEQSLRCVDAYDEGLKVATTKPIEELL